MIEIPGLYRGKSFAEVYESLLRDLFYKPDYVVSPRDLKVNELENVRIEIENPYKSLFENIIRSSKLSYIAAEFLWYLCKSRESSFISKHAKLWDHIKNDDETVNSAYGYLIFEKLDGKKSQWRWAYDCLYLDKDTRQAIMHFNRPEHQFDGNKDFVCTMYASFHIRNGFLNMSVTMRSNDAIKGLPTDIPFFCFLQHQMFLLLKKSGKYPNLRLGKYTHIVNPMHLYESDFDTVENMLKHEFKPIAFQYGNEVLDENGEVIEDYYMLYNTLKNGRNISDINLTDKDALLNWILINIKNK